MRRPGPAQRGALGRRCATFGCRSIRRLRTALAGLLTSRSIECATFALWAETWAVGATWLRLIALAQHSAYGLFHALIDQALQLLRNLGAAAAEALSRRAGGWPSSLKTPLRRAGLAASRADSPRYGTALANPLHNLRHALDEFVFADHTVAVDIQPVEDALQHLFGRAAAPFGLRVLRGPIRVIRRRIRRPIRLGQRRTDKSEKNDSH